MLAPCINTLLPYSAAEWRNGLWDRHEMRDREDNNKICLMKTERWPLLWVNLWTAILLWKCVKGRLWMLMSQFYFIIQKCLPDVEMHERLGLICMCVYIHMSIHECVLYLCFPLLLFTRYLQILHHKYMHPFYRHIKQENTLGEKRNFFRLP